MSRFVVSVSKTSRDTRTAPGCCSLATRTPTDILLAFIHRFDTKMLARLVSRTARHSRMPMAIAKVLGIGRASVHRVLEADSI